MRKIIIPAFLSFILLIGLILPSSALGKQRSYNWQKVSNYGEINWLCYVGNYKVYGWQNIDSNWYYFYNSNGYMAHDTFIDGYYLNSSGAWTKDIPYAVERILEIIPDSNWIYTCGNNNIEGNIWISENQNLKYLCSYGWNAPDINGWLVAIGCGDEFFVANDGRVFKAPHQAYDTIYEYNDYGNIINEYYYKA